MEQTIKQQMQDIANSVRCLSMDAIQKANSGHPGLPLGCADIGAVLYGKVLKHFPKQASWVNRDRFVLSAGHGSMFLYSLLHLSGFNLSMNDLKNFRQMDSITPGHPEVFETDGVEMTTGPLGQGLATAVGMAFAGKLLAEKFNTEKHNIIDYNVYTLAGDGCIMEGVASEASSFAAHYGLDNFVVLYDSNDISLDGDLSESFSENVEQRYEAYGFDVHVADGHDFEEIELAFEWARLKNGKPKLIIFKTVIGKGAPGVQGTSACHGSPLGDSEIKAAKQALGLPVGESFTVLPGVEEYFAKRLQEQEVTYKEWENTFAAWKSENAALYAEYKAMQESPSPDKLEAEMPAFEPGGKAAGRKNSQGCLNALASHVPALIGGSADLSCSDCTDLKGMGFISRDEFKGRNIKFGVREFGMAAIMNGVSLSGFFKPYCGTFLCFSDYMRPAIRLASLIGLDVSYQFTHDSVFLGEDGPTHQPVEHAAALRTIPNLYVFRPADGNETKASWLCGMKHSGPKAYLLSRQNLPNLAETNKSHAEGVGRGAYVLLPEEDGQLDLVMFSSGSELHLALEVANKLKADGVNVRLVSVPCFELFDMQDNEYKEWVLAKHARDRVSIEAQVGFGWEKFTGHSGRIFSVERFGMSAPAGKIQERLGFTVEALYSDMQKWIKR